MTRASVDGSVLQDYRMPAEWEKHEATWLGWPHNPADWPGKMEVIPWVFGEMIRRIAPGERVRILAPSAAHEKQARALLDAIGVDPAQIDFFRIPTNRSWARDFGPIFIKQKGGRGSTAIARFHFNGWSKYPDFELDDAVAEKVARRLQMRLFTVVMNGNPFVLEGGAIDVNGRGVLLTTEECLLDQKRQVRNPGLSRRAVEQALGVSLGIDQVVWLGKGIAGDEDTHGHVDDLCRFVAPSKVVLCREKNAKDANYRALEENRERLEQVRLNDGARLEIIDLPMPAPLFLRRRRLPASYANFYISNSVVLVPTFNDPQDRKALGLLAELFPSRKVCGIHAVDLALGLGAIHCLTQQQPAEGAGARR